jgi:hypothetical protein
MAQASTVDGQRPSSLVIGLRRSALAVRRCRCRSSFVAGARRWASSFSLSLRMSLRAAR